MPPLDLPGMYYDAEKHRYMKIQPDHHARNLSSSVASKVSKSAVAREKEENAKKKRQETISAHLDSCTVRRSKVLQHALGGAPLGYELARASEPPGKVMAKVWCQKLERRHQIELDEWRTQRFSNVVRDPGTGVLYLTVQSGGKNMLGYVCDLEDEERTGRPRVERILWTAHDVVSSLQIIPPNLLCLTTLDGVIELFVMDSDSLRSGSISESTIFDGGQSYLLNPIHPDETLWSSSLSTDCPIPHTSSSPSLALATSHGISVLITNDASHICRGVNYIPARDVLSTIWTSPHVVAGGCRNGKIILADTRIPDRLNSTVRIEHGDSVRKSRAVDEWRVLAAGPEKMALYDLRFSGGTVDLPRPLRGPKQVTRPYLLYEAYEDRRVFPNDLDVDARLGLIAAAKGWKSGLDFFDLWSGKLVPAPSLRKMPNLAGMPSRKRSEMQRKEATLGFPGIVQFVHELTPRHPGFWFDVGTRHKEETKTPTGLLVGGDSVLQLWGADGRDWSVEKGAY